MINSNPHTEPEPAVKQLNRHWQLLFGAFIASGIFEVIDNILGLRQLNFESSSPAIFKVVKEIATIWLIIGIIVRRGMPPLTLFGATILTTFGLCTIPLLSELPDSAHGKAGLIYYLSSLVMLLVTSTLISPDDKKDFARYFVFPLITTIFLTQCIEIALAPQSMYFETNLFGLDRRAGIAVTPTTAGLLGVIGFVTLTGIPRLLSLAVIGLASSTVSLICLAIFIISKLRNPVYALITFPAVAAVASIAITSRAGLESTIMSRLDILADSLQEFYILGPSKIGALTTAKSVALNPFDSYIIDSMYLQIFHIFGIIPGTLLLILIFLLIYRNVGPLAMIMLAIAGIGFLVFEVWIVWLATLFAFQRCFTKELESENAINDRFN